MSIEFCKNGKKVERKTIDLYTFCYPFSYAQRFFGLCSLNSEFDVSSNSL